MIRAATDADVGALVVLINRAFEPERAFIEGDRIDAPEVERLMASGRFLLLEDGAELVGAVYAEIRGSRGYLGLLSIAPALQGRGFGRTLVAAAEDHARDHGCVAMDLRVVDLRSELPPFYRRLGYREIGTQPFSLDGARLLAPCHFIVMSRAL